MIKQILAFLMILLFFAACSNVQEQEVHYKILTPKSDWTYYSDSRVPFSTNVNTDDVLWYSSKDGYVGKGNGFTVKLTPGSHEIKAVLQNFEETVSISVGSRSIKDGQTVKYIINSNEQDILLPEGEYKPAVVALDGSISHATVNENNQHGELKKDIHIDTTIKGKTIIQRAGRSVKKTGYELDDEKMFLNLQQRANLQIRELLQTQLRNEMRSCIEIGQFAMQTVVKRNDTILALRLNLLCHQYKTAGFRTP